MTLPLQYKTIAINPVRSAIDGLTREGRAALLDLTWAAWYTSRSEAAKVMLAGALSDDPLEVARAAGVCTGANLKLMRLRRIAADDREVVAIVDGLLAGSPVLRVPDRLTRVMAASDDDRRAMLLQAQAEVALLPRHNAGTLAAVVAYLVGTEVDYERAAVVEVPSARGFSRAVMHTLGLPFDDYMARMRSWL